MNKNNISKTYLLPLISQAIGLDYSFAKHIVQTYLFDDQDIYKDCFFIEHIFNLKDPSFTKNEHMLTSHPLFRELYDLEDDKVVYVFDFPKEYIEEYNYFKEGKYSKFKEDSKEDILYFWAKVYEDNAYISDILKKVKDILYKDPSYKLKLERLLSSKEHKVTLPKDAELGNLIDKDDETFSVTDAIKYKESLKDLTEKFKLPKWSK